MMKNKRPRLDLDEAARRFANGHYVEQGIPGKVDTSNVSTFIAGYKALKREERPADRTR